MLNKVPVNQIKAFENAFIEFLRVKHSDLLSTLRAGKWSGEQSSAIEAAAREVLPNFEK
jgi:F-type H+-transporting ATPase subunit alpha